MKIFIIMLLENKINRIKSLMYESYGYMELDPYGDIESLWGLRLRLNKNSNNLARIGVINFDNAWKVDHVLRSLYENYNNNKVQDLTIDQNKSSYIFDLYVQEEVREKGFGTKILNIANEESLKKGYNISTLIVENDNLKAIKFYKRNNYSDYLSNDKYTLMLNLNLNK